MTESRIFTVRKLQLTQATMADLVEESYLDTDNQFLRVISARNRGIKLDEWIRIHQASILASLIRNGGILFRGFEVDTPMTFSDAVMAISPNLLDYLERAAARHEVAPRIFTSTELAADQWIPLHHEMAHSHNWPVRIYFYCDIAPTNGGCTPLANERRVTARIPNEIKRQFLKYGVRYVRNYGAGIDMSWQESFQTRSKLDVEEYCRSTKTSWAWIKNNHLQTSQIRQAMTKHPDTGEQLWFNHAHLFHITNMPTEIANALLDSVGFQGLPRNSYYGDGSVIEKEVLDIIHDAYKAETVTFNWCCGDVLMLDNFISVHGREPFQGDRRILVAMTDLHVNRDLVSY